ncbi:26265_t:CDS:2 [Dentiscutata erythropus]|uniref:26265_t:CDS:1 n=1 Tax=Dentiscutata erythropus TaxID=1348616 RepID=A0A9N8V6M5_9GLOM|nr:26265_t:CDS:2 [Dentiscutata erythropus]
MKKPHDGGPFHASADMDSVTKECKAAMMNINGIMYSIVDMPGIFDTKKDTDAILRNIAESVHKCAYGVKAIILVFEARRFTEEQKNALGHFLEEMQQTILFLIGNRWGISPDPNHFLPEDPTYKVQLNEIKGLICDI